MKVKLLFVGLLFMAGIATNGDARTFYVSSSGNDGNAGTPYGNAWKTIAAVNSYASDNGFQPGDTILFHGGDTFTGSIYFPNTMSGTAKHPIVVSSYGNGKALINGGTAVGFYAYNNAGIHVTNLLLYGSGRMTNTSYGMLFYLDLPDTTLSDIVIDSVETFGFLKSGICIGSYNGASGYRNVTITYCISHDNGEAGISSFSENPYCFPHWYVAHNTVYNNTGRPDVTTTNSGSGIVLAGLDTATIEYNESYSNGQFNAHKGGGPMGIWVYASDNVSMQFNESHNNYAGSDADGGGFDLDGGTEYCTMQYNYSHDNEGSGYEIAQYNGAAPMLHNTIRYNISQNDARKNACGGILLWGGDPFNGCEIYNNTIYINNQNLVGTATPAAVYLFGDDWTNVRFWNNIFITSGVPFIISTQSPDTSIAQFINNDYYPGNDSARFIWGDSTITGFSKWRSIATGQEILNGLPTGFSKNPLLVSAGLGQTINNPDSLAEKLGAYSLEPASPMRTSGINLSALFEISTGNRDFYGDTINIGDGISLGADQLNLPPGGITFDERLLNFDTVLIDSSKEMFAELVNNSAFPVRFDSITVVMTSLGEFRLDGRPMLPFIGPNDTASIGVIFAPTKPGLAYDTLKVYFAASVDSVCSIILKGVGKAPDTTTHTAVVAEVVGLSSLQIFPNPAHDAVTLQFGAAEDENEATITIRDLLGKVRFRTVHKLTPKSTSTFSLNFANIPNGFYTAEVQTEKRVLRHNLVVER